MKPDAAGWKLALGYVAWLLAAIAIALILGLLVGSIASLLGLNAQSIARQRVVEVLRHRVNRAGEDQPG